LYGISRVSIILVTSSYTDEDFMFDSIIEQVYNLEVVDEIIVVVDVSDENMISVSNEYEDVKFIQFYRTARIGAALKAGIRAVTGDCVIFWKLSDQNALENIQDLVQWLDEYDMVVGVRAYARDLTWHGRLAALLLSKYAKYAVGCSLPELSSGFRVLDARIAKNFAYLIPNQASYASTLTSLFIRSGYTVKFVALQGNKENSSYSYFGDLLEVTRLGLQYAPLRLFIPVSLLFSFSGGLYVILTMAIESRFSGFGGLFVTIGIFVFMLGLISEQITLLRLVKSEG
jgi:glycosyltransferase involved in cell wall biosynthesis